MSDLFGGKFGFNTSTLVDNLKKQKEDESSSQEKKRRGPFNFLQDQISKLNKSDDDEDDDKLADYLKGKSYMPEKESSRDMLAKFILDRGLGGLGGFGGGNTLSADSGNFSVRYPNLQQPQVVDPGRPASGGIQGAIGGAAQGFLASGFNPAGAIFGGLSGLLS